MSRKFFEHNHFPGSGASALVCVEVLLISAVFARNSRVVTTYRLGFVSSIRSIALCICDVAIGARMANVTLIGRWWRVRHPPQSGWLGEWGRLKGGCPVGLGVALKRAFVDEFRSCRYYHPRPLVRGCICELAPTRTHRGHCVSTGPEVLAREIPLFATQA